MFCPFLKTSLDRYVSRRTVKAFCFLWEASHWKTSFERKASSRLIIKTDLAHCYFTRLNPRKKGTFYFCLPALLRIHRNSKQKEFFRSSEVFLRAALTEDGHPGPLWKIAKMALFNPCMEFENFGPNALFWCTVKVPLSDIFPKVSQALSKCFSK